MAGEEADEKAMKAPYVVAIIPCKMLSRRLPGKNFQDVGGWPMMLWAVSKAGCCPDVNKVVISTDDGEALLRMVPQLNSAVFDRIVLLDRVNNRGPEDPIFLVVIDALQQLGVHGALERPVTHVVMMQPNVPTIPQEVINRLVHAVVHERYNVARHFDLSGAMTGGCDAYKVGAIQSILNMDSYNFGVFTNDLEIHDEKDLDVARQVMKMRPVESDGPAELGG